MQTVQTRTVRFYEVQCDSGETTLNVKENDADDEFMKISTTVAFDALLSLAPLQYASVKQTVTRKNG